MNRKLVLAMAAALALAVGCGDEDDPASGGMCTAETAATDCTGVGNYQGCCTGAGTCGVSLTNACQPACGDTACVAGAAGNVCCDEATGLCGTASGDTCAVQPETAQCLVGGVDTTCPKVGSSPGCCLMDATTGTASCGAYLNGACAATATVQAAILPGSGGVAPAGDGGTLDGSMEASVGPSSATCGTLTCQGQTLPGVGSLNACCTATGACGLDATLYGFTCDTPTNLLTALAGSQGEGGVGTDGGTSEGGVSEGGTSEGGTAVTGCDGFNNLVSMAGFSACCLDTGKCGVEFGGCVDPADLGPAGLGLLPQNLVDGAAMFSCTP